MSIPPPLLRAFTALDDYIGAARDIVHAGQMPDMMGLDRRVSELCASIGEAPEEIQQACLPKLEALLRNLDLCEADIRAARAAPKEETHHG